MSPAPAGQPLEPTHAHNSARFAAHAVRWTGRFVSPAVRALRWVAPARAAQERLSLRKTLPNGPAHWASCALLLATMASYLSWWGIEHKDYLFNPDFQTDDARTVIFPYHRYGPSQALADDPVARDMRAFTTPGWSTIFIPLVKLTNIYVAPKIVQLLALGIVLAGGWLLTRSRRIGLAGGVLFVFMMLHTDYVVGRIAGGLPRAFGLPLIALWGVGVLTNSWRVRIVTPLAAMLLYPSAAGMILAAEGIMLFVGGTERAAWSWSTLQHRLVRYGVLVAACLVLALPYFQRSDLGPVHTLEQAKAEPAFRARLGIPPFANPVHRFAESIARPFKPAARRMLAPVADVARKVGLTITLLCLTLLLLLPLYRLTPLPREALAILVGAVCCYFLARTLAFRLYSPTRYYMFGGSMATILITVSVFGRFGTNHFLRHGAALRNFVTLAFIALVCVWVGDGIVPNNMMTIRRGPQAALYQHVQALPTTARIAAHPGDSDNIPLWAGRAMMGGFETMQPWFVNSWRRQKRRFEATLRAMYATSRDAVRAYAAEHGVTHFLIRRDRYRSDYRRRAHFIRPFNGLIDDWLASRPLHRLVWHQIDPGAVVYRWQQYQLVDLGRLFRAWDEERSRNERRARGAR